MNRVVVISTGGTIASRAGSNGAVASDDAGALLARLPFDVGVPIEGRDVLCVGSYLLTPSDMAGIVWTIRAALADESVLGVVVTHGTDTMEETAFLAEITHDDERPVVFTGAQRPADAPDTDGPRNLADAITIAASPEARGRGVLISFDGSVFGARGTRKTHTVATGAFTTPGAGPLGYVREGDVTFVATPERFPAFDLEDLSGVRVDIVPIYPGADTAALDAVVAAGAAGIVLEATGAGNGNLAFRDAVSRLTDAGIVVALSTRVHEGVVAGLYGNGGGADLIEAGAVPTGALRPSQARILLAALIARYHRDPERVGEELAKRSSTSSVVRPKSARV